MFNKLSSANAESAITDFLTDNNVSKPVLNLALKREMPSLQAVEKDLTQSDMRELVSDQLDPYLSPPTNLQGALLGVGIGGSLGGVGIPLMLRQHAAKVPSLGSLAKRTAVGTGLGALAGAGIGFAADRLFRDRELRDAYEAGAMKTSQVSGQDIALGGTGLALGAGSAYLGGPGGTALQRALSNRAARGQITDDLGQIVEFDPKRVESLTNKINKLDSLSFDGAEGNVAQNKRAALQKNLDNMLRARDAQRYTQRYQNAADLMPAISRWGSRAGLLAGGGLLTAGIVGAARRNSKTSSDNSTGLMVGGGLGALGAGVGSYYGAKKSVRGINDRANALLAAINAPVVDLQSTLDKTDSQLKRILTLPDDLDKQISPLEARQKEFWSVNNLLNNKYHHISKEEFSARLSELQQLLGLKKNLKNIQSEIDDLGFVSSNLRGRMNEILPGIEAESAKITDEAAIAARNAARNWRIGGGLGVAAGLGALGLGLHRKFSND